MELLQLAEHLKVNSGLSDAEREKITAQYESALDKTDRAYSGKARQYARQVPMEEILSAVNLHSIPEEQINRFREGETISVHIDEKLDICLMRGEIVLFYDGEFLRRAKGPSYAHLYDEISAAILKEQEKRDEEDLPF